MSLDDDTSTNDRLAVVFAPGLWPYRVDLDAFSWLLGQGIARGLSRLPGIIGYATPRARVDRVGDHAPIRVYRSLPPDRVVRAECLALDAAWAITGRLLRDKDGFEFWLNLLDAPTGILLWTDRVFSPPQKFLWRLAYLVRELAKGAGERLPDAFGLNDLFPTGSFESFIAFARAYGLRNRWRGDVATGIEIVRAASRAAALDYSFEEAASMMLEVGLGVVERLERVTDSEALRDAVLGSSDFEPSKRLRRAIHERHLALAEGDKQT